MSRSRESRGVSPLMMPSFAEGLEVESATDETAIRCRDPKIDGLVGVLRPQRPIPLGPSGRCIREWRMWRASRSLLTREVRPFDQRTANHSPRRTDRRPRGK